MPVEPVRWRRYSSRTKLLPVATEGLSSTDAPRNGLSALTSPPIALRRKPGLSGLHSSFQEFDLSRLASTNIAPGGGQQQAAEQAAGTGINGKPFEFDDQGVVESIS